MCIRDRGDMKNENRNVKSHVKGSVTHKGRGNWMRLGNRKGWPRDEGNSDGKQSCSRKEIVWVNWRKNEPARENSVSVIESKRGKPKENGSQSRFHARGHGELSSAVRVSR